MERFYNNRLLKTVFILSVLLWPLRRANAQATADFTPQVIEAGTDYVNEVELPNPVFLTVTIPVFKYNASILVKYNKINWSNELSLYIKRTGAGASGLCIPMTANGGTTYLKIRTFNLPFFLVDRPFLGCTELTDIPLQLKLSGLSVTVPADNYSCRVVITVAPQ